MPSTKDAFQVGTGCFSFILGYVVLGVALKGNQWHAAECLETGSISSRTRISVFIGLEEVMVSISGPIERDLREEMFFHERFSWAEGYMKNHLKMALRKGHPGPVLTVLEYLSEDYPWGIYYAYAGRLVTVFLWLSFASGLVILLLSILKHKQEIAVSLASTGLLLVICTVLYNLCLPQRPLLIRFSNCALEFVHGWSYYITLYSGLLSIAFGFTTLYFKRASLHEATNMQINELPSLYYVQRDPNMKDHFVEDGT